MHYYTHNIGDFALETRGLSYEEIGIYITLIDRYAATQEPLTDEWIEVAFKGDSKCLASALLKALFARQDAGWVHSRTREMIAQYADLSDKRRAAGAKGGKKKAAKPTASGKDSHAEASKQEQSNCLAGATQPITNNQEPIDIGGAKAPCALSRPEAAKGAPAPAPPADESIFSEAEEAKAAETAETEEAEASDTTEAEEPKAAPSKPKLAYPRCEIQKVVDLYHQNCPGLRRVTALNAARRSAISARWKDFCREDHYTETAQVLDAFDWYFKRVAASPFLMGQTNPGYGRERPFVAHFDWLMKSSNFLKVCEGAYNAA